VEAKQSIRERLRLGLGQRLTGLVVLAVLVAGGLVGAVLIESSRSALREQIIERNLAAADLAAQFVANYVEGAETNLHQFSVRRLPLSAIFDHDVEQTEAYLAQFLQIDARFDNIAVYDAQGIGWASGLMDQWQNRGGSVADREWFQQTMATQKPYLGIPVVSHGTGQAVVTYAVPLFDDQGEMRAILVGDISLAALSDAITGLRVSASARASLMDARQGGIIVAHSDPQRILTPVTEQDAAALRAIAGERGAMETRSSSELDLAAFAPVPQLPWAVMILEPAEAAFAPVNALTQRALWLLGITTAIAVVLGVLLARTITQPVRQLVMGAEEIGRGNLEYRIEVATRDEIGQLSQAFNQMTENLQAITASHDELNREIAERKRAEELVEERTQELREAQERLIRQEKLAVLGQLAGGVGHELRNPLGAIKNAAYFLNMVLEEPNPEVKETLEILEKEVATSERIISSLLGFARPKPPTQRKVDVNEVVQEALSHASVPENVGVVSQLEALPTILADPDQLSQVFGNIILNAIQAMPEGGQLTVKTWQVSGKPARSEQVVVSFTDTGGGISEENLKKIFEPLFTTKAKGIGLGLAVVKTLVDGHGGSIGVESEVGKGSMFTVRLPVS
jgi:signal transduction histidine kinase